MNRLIRDLVEAAGLAAAVAGAALLFGPVGLLVGGAAVVAAVEATNR